MDFVGLRAGICAGVAVVVHAAQFRSYRDWRSHAKCSFIDSYNLHRSEHFQWRPPDEIFLDLDGAGICHLALLASLVDLL